MNQGVPIEKVIELRELRIGNILSYKGEFVHVTNLSCDIDDEYIDQIGFCLLGKTSNEISDWNRALCRDLDRVTITKEILQSCGYHNTHGEGELYWIYRDFMDNNEAFRNDTGLLNIEDNGFKLMRKSRHIKYLHELQNLFFVLSGKEIALLK